MAMTPAFWFLRAPPREQPVEEAPDSKHEIIICPADEAHRRGDRWSAVYRSSLIYRR
jgi:hypothetical protein